MNSSSIHPYFSLLWHLLIPTSYIQFSTKYANNYYYNTPRKSTTVNVINVTLGGEVNIQYWTNIWVYKWYQHLSLPPPPWLCPWSSQYLRVSLSTPSLPQCSFRATGKGPLPWRHKQAGKWGWCWGCSCLEKSLSPSQSTPAQTARQHLLCNWLIGQQIVKCRLYLCIPISL